MKSHKTARSSAPKMNLNLLSGIQEELKQVTWPTRAEAVELTLTVITISLIVAVFVGIIDISLAKILQILSQN